MMSNQLVLLSDKLSFSMINGQRVAESGAGLIEMNTELKFDCFGSIG